MTKISHLRIFFLIGVALGAGSVRGETIFWSSRTGAINYSSTGLAMDSTYQFQLGVFKNGFIPTASNTAQWAGNWESAQPTTYQPARKLFESEFTVPGNTGAFVVGAKAYVWGRVTAATKDEWILFRKSDWVWPSAAASPPNFYYWNAEEADQVILGTINPSGSPLMQSVAIYSYAQWRDDRLAGNPLNAPNQDPDQDGVSNLMEFVFGTSPSIASLVPFTPTSLVTISGQTYLQISIPRLRNRLVAFTVEVSSDLNQWISGDTYTAEVSNTAEALVVRDKTPTGPGLSRRFMRLKAVVQP